MKLKLLIILMLCAGLAVGDGISRHKVDSIDLSITDIGDTAQVSKRTPVLAIDSFVYIDTFSYQPDTTAHQTITWLSPLQTMILDFGAITDSETYADTTVSYMCSLQLDGGTLGIIFDPSANIASDSMSVVIDSFVAVFNAKAVLTDTIDAQDSGTYVKLVSLFGQRQLAARWDVVIGDSLDTTGTVTTIAMVADSMVAIINADAGLDSFLTAIDSTTFYITQSDDPGVLFWDSSLNHVDTHATVARSQANVTSYSTFTDTIFLEHNYPSLPSDNFTGILGTFIIDSSDDLSGQGVGLDDTGFVKFLVGRESHGGNITYFPLDSVTCTSFPCTLRVVHLPDIAGADSLFKENMYLIFRVSDSASDTNAASIMPTYFDYMIMSD